MIQLYILISIAIGFGVVIYTVPRIIRISKFKKLYDFPHTRPASRVNTPTIGGIAIFAGFYTSLIISLTNFEIHSITCLLLALVVMFLTGLKDDLVGMSARKKLFFQFVTVTYLILMGGVRITHLHGVLGLDEIGLVPGAFLTLFAMVGLINAFNLIDGIDGLAAGTSILISIVFGILFIMAGEPEYTLVCFSLTGSLLAFFLYNVFGKENKIFMGDTGSLTLGVIFAFLMVKYLELPGGVHPIVGSPAIALAILIVPVIDTLRVMILRLSQGRSPFSPDMKHIHHQLIRINGNNHLLASMVLVSANLVFILFAFWFQQSMDANLLFMILVAAGFTLAYVPALIRRKLQKPEPTLPNPRMTNLRYLSRN